MNSINIITTHIRKIYDFSIVPEAIHISLDRPTYSPFVSIPIHHIPPHPSPFLLFHIIILLPQYSSSSNPSLQISPSEMNEGSTLERGNSAKFILSPILLIPRVIGRVRATSTTETGILYIYLYRHAFTISSSNLVSRRITVAKENRRRRLEILSRFHSLASNCSLVSIRRKRFRFPLFLSLFLSLSSPSIVCPVQAQSGIVPTVERREPCSAARKLNINRRQLCFDKIVTRRRHCHRDKRVNLVCLASLPPIVRSPNVFPCPPLPPLLSTMELFDYSSIPFFRIGSLFLRLQLSRLFSLHI